MGIKVGDLVWVSDSALDDDLTIHAGTNADQCAKYGRLWRTYNKRPRGGTNAYGCVPFHCPAPAPGDPPDFEPWEFHFFENEIEPYTGQMDNQGDDQ